MSSPAYKARSRADALRAHPPSPSAEYLFFLRAGAEALGAPRYLLFSPFFFFFLLLLLLLLLLFSSLFFSFASLSFSSFVLFRSLSSARLDCTITWVPWAAPLGPAGMIYLAAAVADFFVRPPSRPVLGLSVTSLVCVLGLSVASSAGVPCRSRCRCRPSTRSSPEMVRRSPRARL